MKEQINKIFDAADSARCKIVEIEAKSTFAKVKFERDYVNFELVIDCKDSFTRIASDIWMQFIRTRATIKTKQQ